MHNQSDEQEKDETPINVEQDQKSEILPITLLERQSRGGETAQKGFSFQESYVLAAICEWLSSDGFTSMITEGIGDTEANFYVAGKGYEKEFIELKNHSMGTPEFWKEIKRFQDIDTANPGTYRKFVLACTGLVRELETVVNELNRIRGPLTFYGRTSPIITASLKQFRARIVDLGKTSEIATFLFEKVEIETKSAMHQNQGEALFTTALPTNLPEYQDIPNRKLVEIYNSLNKFIGERRNTTITRKQLETKIRENINSEQLPSLRPIELYTLSQPQTSETSNGQEISKGIIFDWVDFAGNNGVYPPPQDWENRILGELLQTRDWILANRSQRRIRLTNIRRISTSLAVGSVFSAVRGFTLETDYYGKTFAADDYPDDTTPDYNWEVANSGSGGDRLIVSIGVPRRISDEVETYMLEQEGTRLSALHLFGEKPFVSARHANLAVAKAKTFIINARIKTNAKQIEFFVASPDYFALFLGHRLNGIAPIQCYQYINPGSYVPACFLR